MGHTPPHCGLFNGIRLCKLDHLTVVHTPQTWRPPLPRFEGLRRRGSRGHSIHSPLLGLPRREGVYSHVVSPGGLRQQRAGACWLPMTTLSIRPIRIVRAGCLKSSGCTPRRIAERTKTMKKEPQPIATMFGSRRTVNSLRFPPKQGWINCWSFYTNRCAHGAPTMPRPTRKRGRVAAASKVSRRCD